MADLNQQHRSGCIRVLLVHDNPPIPAGMYAALTAEADLTIVGEASGGADLQRMSSKFKPDVILLDIEMYTPLSLETITYLHQRIPKLKFTALTNGDDDALISDLVAAGVTGCILKTEPPVVIGHAIRSVAQGGTWFSQAILAKLTQAPPLQPGKEPPLLTEAESTVLRLVAEGQSDAQIGRELNLSERMVRYRLQNIYEKLEVNSRIAAAVKAVRQGLI